MILQPLSKGGKTATTQTSSPVSSTRVLAPLSKTTTKTTVSKTPVISKTKTVPITPPKIIAKPSVTIKGEPSGVQRLKIASKAGIKSLPSILKIGGAIIAENIAMQQRYIQKVSPKILGGAVGLNTTSPVDKILEPLYKKIEKKAPDVREKAIKERQTKIEPYAKLSKPQGKAQTIAEALVFNLPQMGASMGLTVATGLLTKNPALTTSVGLSTSYGLGASEVYTEARANGLSDKQALPLSTVGGAVIGALDFTGVFRLIRKTTSPVTKEIEKSIVKNVAKQIVSVGTQSGIEGITEGLQEVVGNAIRISYSENKDLKQLVDNVGVASVVGAIMGGGVDATLSIGSLAKGATLQETLDNVDSTIENALKTPPKERTPEEKAIVEEALTQNLTPDEAVQLVTEGNLTTTTEGKEIMKSVLEAKQNNQNIKITFQEEGGVLNIDLVSPKEEENLLVVDEKKEEPIPAKEISEETPKGEYSRKEDIEGYKKYLQPEASKNNKALLEKLGVKPDENGMVTLYRGSTQDNPNTFRAYSYFSTSEKLAQRFADSNDGGKVSIVKVNPDDLVANGEMGEGVTFLNPVNLVKQEDGSYGIEEKKKEQKVQEVSTKDKEAKLEPTKIAQKEEKVDEKPTKQSKDEPIGTGREKNSRLFERVKETLGAEYEAREIKYNELSLEKQADDVIALIEKDPERATRIARGFEEPPPGITRNAVSIALAELARSQGDFQTASELWTKTSLRSTRLGQEIVTLRGGFMETETLNAVKRVLDIRLDNVAKKYKNVIAGLNVSEDASTIKKVDALVSHEARKLKKEMKKRQVKIKNAQEIIDSIRC